jgi:hypothetical protein
LRNDFVVLLKPKGGVYVKPHEWLAALDHGTPKKPNLEKEKQMNTKKIISTLTALILGIGVGLVLATQVSAQEQKAGGKPKEDRLSGTIQMINKDDSTITLRKGNVTRTVVYNNDTKVTKHNKPGSLDEVKEGRRVICLGQFDDRTRLVATRIDVRDENP